MDNGKLLCDAVRGARAGGWEYVRGDERPGHEPWRFHATPELKALIGYADHDLDDAPDAWMSKLHPDDVSLFEGALGRCFHGLDERLDAVFRVRHRDGRWRTVRASGSVEREGNGRARRLYGLTWDVTQHVADRERSDLISRAFDWAVGGLAICDHEFRVLEANRALHRISGWPDGEIKGKPFAAAVLGGASSEALDAAWQVVRQRGAWIGQLDAVRRDGSAYPAEVRLSAIREGEGPPRHYSALVFDLLAMRASPTVASADARERARHEAASSLQPMLELAIKESVGMRSGLVVFVLGVDGLTSMIESYGRQRVEGILEACLERLRDAHGDIVIAARTDADRFVVVISDLLEERDIEQAFARLLRAIADLTANGKSYHVTASAGAAVFPLDGTSAEILLQRARGALEETQRRWRSAASLQLYRPQFSDYASDRIHLEASLRKALRAGAFECHLQPKVRLTDGHWVGAEALIRWRVGDTWIPPSRFIPIAEESGLIKDLGRWVLWEAAAHVAQWRREQLVDEHFRVAVNLAGAQLDRELLRTVRAVLSYNQLPSEALMLELTETIIVNDPQRAQRLLDELRRIGVRIALDDFGTGYTSMSQLQTLPVDELKIDQSFVRGLPGDETSCAIARSVATLAQGLKLELIAEGVETEAQRAALLKLGYRHAQGHLFARAMAPVDFEQALREQRQPAADGTHS